MDRRAVGARLATIVSSSTSQADTGRMQPEAMQMKQHVSNAAIPPQGNPMVPGRASS